jgi:hypothetical protein
VIERRAHPPECLRQEEWGEIKEFMRNTDDYRAGLHETLETIRKENKERFEIILAELRSRDVDINDRVTRLKTQAGQIVFWGVVSLISFATAWGALSSTVYRNTGIIHDLQAYHQKAVSDGKRN